MEVFTPDSPSSTPPGTSPGGPPAPAGCLAAQLTSAFGKGHLLVGAQMLDEVATQAPFDLRYMYISGALADGAGPCTSCASGCTSQGRSCRSGTSSCAWWGCWQWDQLPPGEHARLFLEKAATHGHIPFISYYTFLPASGLAEGTAQLAAANDPTFLSRYLADWRFLLQQVGDTPALLHIEPDLWGYAQRAQSNPHALPAAVSSANPTDCAGQEDSFAGLGRCMIAMVRKYAPKAKVGLQASAWATWTDVSLNRSSSLNVAAEAHKVADFLLACGTDQADFIAVEASDRDAGWYQSQGQDRWWDETNATLPNFRQAFTWAKALAERAGKPLVWWQVPVGHKGLPNSYERWQDNRVDYFFSHPEEVAATHAALMAFGAGIPGQTSPSTDGGNLVAKVRAYAASGRQPLCP